MVNLLRKHHQTLLIFITILVIVSFIYYWNGQQAGRANIGGFGVNTVAHLYGQPITDTDVQRDSRRFQVALSLGLTDLLQGLAGSAQDQQHAFENFLWNSRVLRHEADALQVYPSDSAVEKEETSLPAFQTDGKFDAMKLKRFVTEALPPLGFTDTAIDDLVRDEVRLKMIRDLVGATVELSPAELENRFAEENQKMNVSVVRLNSSDLENGITISDADIKKAFEQRGEQFKTDEQRKVAVAALELSDAEKALKGKERTDALQKLANKAGDFAEAIQKKDAKFDDVARSAGAKLAATGFFTANQPDPSLPNVPSIPATAFHLTKDAPVSDVLEGTNGFYVLRLDDAVPAKPLTLEQAKPAVIAQLKKERAAEMLQTKANEIRTKLQATLKAGKSIADAATEAGVKAEAIPPFSLTEPAKADVPDSQAIMGSAITLADKQLSDFTPTEAGGIFVYVDSRQPIDKATAIIGESISKSGFEKQKRMAAFAEWLRLRLDAAKLQISQR